MKALRISSLIAMLPAFGCLIPADDGQEPDDGSSGAGNTMTTSSTDPDGSSSSPTSATESGSTSDADESSSSGPDPDSSTGDPPMPANCTSASLLMGNPYFNGEFEGWNPDGQGLRADPPLRSRHLASLDGGIAVETQFEIWLADETEVHRIAGDEAESSVEYQPSGACADVRVLIADGIAALPGNRLVVADFRGNGLVELTDPFGDCTAAPIAGNPEATLDIDIDGDIGVAAPGDIDGPGADARFLGVSRPISDADGNLYVIDVGNTKIKRVADDADRTVTTLTDFGGAEEYLVMAMTVLDGTLYATGGTIVADFLWAIDLETGERVTVFEGDAPFEEIDSSQSAVMFGLTHDGVDLLVASNKGYIFRMSTAGEQLATIAGIGNVVDYPPGLDLDAPIPLDELPIDSYGINQADLVRHGEDLLFTNRAGGVGFHVWSIACE